MPAQTTSPKLKPSPQKKLPFCLRIRCLKQSKPKTKKSKTQAWRDKLKHENPTKYKEVKEMEKTYSRHYRLKMSLAHSTLKKRNASEEEKKEAKKWLEKKQHYNEGCKVRQRKYAAKKRINKEKEKDKPAKPLLTRQQYEKKKSLERDRKRVQRAGYSKERKQAILARRRELYAVAKEKERNQILEAQKRELVEKEQRLKKMDELIRVEEEKLQRQREEMASMVQELENRNNQLSHQSPSKEVDMRSDSAKRQSLHRAKSAMPKKPAHFAGTLSAMVQKASPCTTKAISSVGVRVEKAKRNLTLDEAVAVEIGKGLHGKSADKKVLGSTLSLLKKYKLQRQACKRFQVSSKLLRRNKQVQGRKKVEASLVKEVKTFYEVNSSQLPHIKLVSKKTKKPLHVMDRPVAVLYNQYVKSHPDKHVGKSLFYSLRPKHVKTKHQAKYYGCLCEYCENTRLKLKVLSSHLVNSELAPHVNNIYSLSDFTLCKKPDGAEFHKKKCIQRKCENCGVGKLDVLKDGRGDKIVEWKCWDYIDMDYQSKKVGSETKTVKKRALVVKKTTIADLVEALKKEAQPFSMHLFNKDWQHRQQKHLQANLPESSVLSIIDFSENYKCSYQQEVQSAYYSQNAATLHPIVNYYRCPSCSRGVQESCIMISNDLKHDYHLVNTFQRVVHSHLKETRKLDIKTMYIFSDGCSSQYKSKGPISNISYASQDFNCKINHNYFGSRHGKGASDGEGAVVKSQASDAVLSGAAVIGDAEALFNFTRDHLTRESKEGECCRSFLRTAFYIPQKDVKRDMSDRHPKTLKGTRKLHSIKTVGESGGKVATRRLSCFCNSCLEGRGVCSNSLYVDKWKHVDLRGGTKSDVCRSTTRQDGANEDSGAHVCGENLVSGEQDGNTETTGYSEQDASQELVNGAYVAVKFLIQHEESIVIYLAMVTGTLIDGVKLKFLRRTTGGHYTFTEEREHIHPRADIVMTLTEPTLVTANRRAFVYQFVEEELLLISQRENATLK